MKFSMPKYLRNIATQVDFRIRLVNKPLNEQQNEASQSYYDEILEIYKTAFNELIERAVTYSSILFKIKNAYENAIKIRDDRISAFITQDRIYGISARKKEHDDAVERLINENEQLRDTNSKLCDELCTANRNVGKLEELRSRDNLTLSLERDARYTLYAENMQLQLKVKQLDGSQDLHQTGGDPVLMRIALDRCREQLSSTQHELVVMKAEYEDSVTRAEYEQLEATLTAQARELRALHTEHAALHDELKRCAASKKSLEEELSECRSRCIDLERCGTPRPHWPDCGDFISGGGDRWRKLSAGLTSREKLRALLKELGPAAESEHLEYFDGLGHSPSIPAYLRYSGRVRNLRLSRRQVALVISDVWRGKRDHPDLTLADYVTAYFDERYQQPSIRAEWAYNVCAAAEQAMDDLQVKLFWGVLHSVVSERVYWGLRAHWDQLREHLCKQADGRQWMSMDQFEKGARVTFPLKSEVDIRNLADVVKKQLRLTLSNNQINLEKLFQETAEGFERCDLAQELYRQRSAAQSRFLREVAAQLQPNSRSDRTDRAGTGTVTVDGLKRAFAVVDPAIDHIRMERHIRWAFSLSAEQPLESAPALPLRALLARLAAGDIERAGPRSKPSHRRTHYK